MADDKALSFLRLIRRSQRGKLKVYLGYGAGVGKTWQMLQEGHRLQKEGVMWSWAWWRPMAAKRRPNSSKAWKWCPGAGCSIAASSIEEMDLDAVLARRPEVALVDELAHTNVPGSKNAQTL